VNGVVGRKFLHGQGLSIHLEGESLKEQKALRGWLWFGEDAFEFFHADRMDGFPSQAHCDFLLTGARATDSASESRESEP